MANVASQREQEWIKKMLLSPQYNILPEHGLHGGRGLCSLLESRGQGLHKQMPGARQVAQMGNVLPGIIWGSEKLRTQDSLSIVLVSVCQNQEAHLFSLTTLPSPAFSHRPALHRTPLSMCLYSVKTCDSILPSFLIFHDLDSCGYWSDIL